MSLVVAIRAVRCDGGASIARHGASRRQFLCGSVSAALSPSPVVAAICVTRGLAAAAVMVGVKRMCLPTGVRAGSSRARCPATARSSCLEDARALMKEAQNVAVLTGAGISTDSGVPDFRGPKGVWTQDPSMARLVDLNAWMADVNIRQDGWQWLASWNLEQLEPNRGHEAIVELYRQGKLNLCVTQNTEGLQEKAGLPLSRLVTIHGSRRHVNCMGRPNASWLDFNSKPEVPRDGATPTDEYPGSDCHFWCYSHELLRRVENGEPDPHCPVCGYILKTANISFGQSLVQRDLGRAMDAAQSCDLLLAVGSTLSVYPIAGMVPEARAAGARIIIVNGEATEMDSLADVVVRGSISDLLPQIVEEAGSSSKL